MNIEMEKTRFSGISGENLEKRLKNKISKQKIEMEWNKKRSNNEHPFSTDSLYCLSQKEIGFRFHLIFNHNLPPIHAFFFVTKRIYFYISNVKGMQRILAGEIMLLKIESVMRNKFQKPNSILPKSDQRILNHVLFPSLVFNNTFPLFEKRFVEIAL